MQEGGKRTTGRLRCGPELGLVRALAARTCGASASTLNSLAKPVLSSSMLRVPSPSVSSVLNTCRTRPGGMPWLAAVWGVASATLSPANAAAATSVMVPVCAGKRRQPRSPRNVPRSVQRSLGENFRTERILRPELRASRVVSVVTPHNLSEAGCIAKIEQSPLLVRIAHGPPAISREHGLTAARKAEISQREIGV